MENRNKNTIRSYRDLKVYQNLYTAMKIVITQVVPKLPKEEKYDLADQMRRCSKSSPAVIAEGFAKRYQKGNWKKYINDTIGECNEMVHHLPICIDIYYDYIDVNLCKKLIEIYDISSKQLWNLYKSWKNFHENE